MNNLMLGIIILDAIMLNINNSKNNKWGKIANISLSIAIICAGINLYLS